MHLLPRDRLRRARITTSTSIQYPVSCALLFESEGRVQEVDVTEGTYALRAVGEPRFP